MIDASPLLLVLYLCGTTSILLSIGDLLSLNLSTNVLLVGLSAVLNTAFWFLYTRHGKLFVYISTVLVFAAAFALAPRIVPLTFYIRYMTARGLPLNQLPVDAFSVLLFVFLITFFLFALEFVLRNHSIMLAGGVVLLLLVPIFDRPINVVTMILLAVYEVGFIVVNMSERRSNRTVMTMPHRSRINVASVVLALLLAAVVVVPSLILEKTTERELFSASYAADDFIKDTVARLTGNTSGSSVNNGNINRGNLYQSGRRQLAITLDRLPTGTLYLKGYTGRDYEDSHWSNAFLLTGDNSFGGSGYREPFMNGLINDIAQSYRGGIPYSFYYLIYDSSDPIEEMYYLMADSTTFNQDYFEVVDVGGTSYLQTNPTQSKLGYLLNNTAASIWIRSLTTGTAANFFLPYRFRDSEARLFGQRADDGTYSNRYLTEAQINAADKWADNPVYERLVESYQHTILQEYTGYPKNTFSRMETLCQEEPLTDLNEITTYILVTLQNKATYTTTPGTTPYNKDVIDYFLFDNGQGYCVHFASAATLMYRMYGIPARYVTGYVATAADFTPNDQYEGYYSCTLTDKSAHAWVEIFLKDYGWVPVEVTPTTEGTMNASYPGYNYTVMRSIMDRHHWTFRGDDNSTDDTGNGGADGGLTDLSNNIFLIVTAIVLLAFAGIVLFLLIRRKRVLASLSTMSCRRLFDRILRMLHDSQLLRDCNGSEEDFPERLAAVTSLSLEDTTRLINILLQVNYAESKVPLTDRDFLEQLSRTLAAELYDRTPLLKKLFFKYFHAYL